MGKKDRTSGVTEGEDTDSIKLQKTTPKLDTSKWPFC